MRRAYWDYYLTIEDDLLATSRYVDFVPDNFRCYSIEFARILLVVGSELDKVFKELCSKSVLRPDSESSASTIR